MSNPFDYDDVEAAKQFEKNTIFGIDADLDDDFMKVSLAAANMNTGVDNHDGSFKMGFSRQSHSGSFTSSGTSVRGHVNTTTSVTKPHFEARKKDINFNSHLDKEVTIDEVIQKSPQISAADYRRMQDELARAKKMIETLKYEKWTSIPVGETVKRIVSGQQYTLDGYKSMADKKGLLKDAVKSGDGNAIITVVIFLERTLSSQIFQRELSNCPTASHHYMQHLRRNKDWRKLEQFYKDSSLIENAALLKYELANEKKDIQERILALHEWLNEYGEWKITEISDLKAYISDEIKLLEKQRQIEVEDKAKEASDPIMHLFPRYGVELKSLIKTVEYCALYHYSKGKHFHPADLKEVFHLNNKQYEWAVISPLSHIKQWTDIDELLTSTNIFRTKTDFSHIGFENVVRVLYKAKATNEIMIKYANLIPNPEVRIKYAEKLSLHDVAIDAIVQLKDKRRMEEYRSIIGDTSRQHVQKINDLLHNSSIKWR